MTTEQKELIKATVPILKEHGVILTTYFYNRMFTHNPELKNIFNMGNQQAGKQQTALALAVLAYAEHIEDPSVLLPMVDQIGQKHTSLTIQPEQYLIVGNHLLASISEVLGETATPMILDAWAAAYQQLADLMCGYEAGLYSKRLSQPHSWANWRSFVIKEKIAESDEITSFYLYPADGGKVPLHKPGQFISIRLFLPELNIHQIRQYSISCTPNDAYYRISVKREQNSSLNINGMISNRLHDDFEAGSIVELTAPSGNFVLPDHLDSPVMFISGGVGLTPFVSMLHHLVDTEYAQPITWLHGCRHNGVHAFKEVVNNLAVQHGRINQHVFYNSPDREDIKEGIYEGFLDIASVKNLEHQANTNYYICGPGPFIQKQVSDLKKIGVSSEYIFFEEFGPQVIQLN